MHAAVENWFAGDDHHNDLRTTYTHCDRHRLARTATAGRPGTVAVRQCGRRRDGVLVVAMGKTATSQLLDRHHSVLHTVLHRHTPHTPQLSPTV
jgi:hypothetical protein